MYTTSPVTGHVETGQNVYFLNLIHNSKFAFSWKLYSKTGAMKITIKM